MLAARTAAVSEPQPKITTSNLLVAIPLLYEAFVALRHEQSAFI